MNKILAVFSLILLVGCIPPATEGEYVGSEGLSRASFVADSLLYDRDSRTGLCFAFRWLGVGRGGMAVTNVPCEAVPESLFVTRGTHVTEVLDN